MFKLNSLFYPNIRNMFSNIANSMFYFCSTPVDLGDMETESVESNSQDNNVSNSKLGLSCNIVLACINCQLCSVCRSSSLSLANPKQFPPLTFPSTICLFSHPHLISSFASFPNHLARCLFSFPCFMFSAISTVTALIKWDLTKRASVVYWMCYSDIPSAIGIILTNVCHCNCQSKV